jgi:quercetin dioxygenase-like cupin family protein
MDYHNDHAVIVRAEPLPAGMGDMHAKIDAIESALREQGEIALDLRHYFSHKIYAREMFIPKGTVVTGKIHKHENLNILLSGELSVLLADGVRRMRAPMIIVSPPGTRRVAYAHEDTVWVTIHGTEEQDLDKIESEFVAQSQQDYLTFCAALQDKRGDI